MSKCLDFETLIYLPYVSFNKFKFNGNNLKPFYKGQITDSLWGTIRVNHLLYKSR